MFSDYSTQWQQFNKSYFSCKYTIFQWLTGRTEKYIKMKKCIICKTFYSYMMSFQHVRPEYAACWLTLCEYAGHVDAPEWRNGGEVSVLGSCGRVKMALQRLGEHGSSVVGHVDGSNSRVWSNTHHTHTHKRNIKQLTAASGCLSKTPKHSLCFVYLSYRKSIISYSCHDHHHWLWPPGSSTCMKIMSWLADRME